MIVKRWVVLLMMLLTVTGVLACDDDDDDTISAGDADTDTDTDSDGDADGDTDGDTDGDADGDADGDTDGDSDGDTDGDSDGDSDGDADGDADGDSDGDADGDADTWPEDVRGEPCDNYDPDPEDYDYGDDYAKGPYGFKTSLCWNENGNGYDWGGGGDTLHNFCLPNQDDEEVCLGDLYQGENDLLILAFSAEW